MFYPTPTQPLNPVTARIVARLLAHAPKPKF